MASPASYQPTCNFDAANFTASLLYMANTLAYTSSFLPSPFYLLHDAVRFDVIKLIDLRGVLIGRLVDLMMQLDLGFGFGWSVSVRFRWKWPIFWLIAPGYSV